MEPSAEEHNDKGEHRRILDLMLPLIAGEKGLDHCVATDPDRWRRNLATYARFGMIDHAPPYHTVVCDRFMMGPAPPGPHGTSSGKQ